MNKLNSKISFYRQICSAQDITTNEHERKCEKQMKMKQDLKVFNLGGDAWLQSSN